MAKRHGSTAADAAGKPTAEAREALAMWGLALRYATAAVKPVAKGATHVVKERLSSATSSETSLKDRLNPSTTEKGGKAGDAADALLGKMGKPGKLASKASLGSRMVGRLAPGTDEESGEPEPTDESEEPIEEPEAAADGEEPVEEPETAEAEDDEPETAAESEPSGSDADSEAQDDQDEAEDDPEEPATKSAAPEGTRPVKPHSKPVEPHPGAEPLRTDFDHAYSEEVENYEHRDAYATTR
jgi:hypothetical protein